MNTEKKNSLMVKNITVEYTSGEHIVKAVNDVSFVLEEGKAFGLVGETGAGKTTIAKTIMQILPVPPARFVEGEVIIDGKNITSIPENEKIKLRGDKIAMIFQDPMTALNPLMTVGDQISEVLSVHNSEMSSQECMKKAIEMLELVGIPGERFTEYPHQFSGGMKQRVVIAIALACDPDILLADEPTTALDVTIQAQILDLIKELQKKRNMSMMLVTHDLGIVAEYCDDVAVIYAGEIVECGTKEKVFRGRKHPYTVGLFNSLPSMTGDEKRLSPIPGLPPDPTDLPSGCKFAPRCKYADEACRKAPVELTEVEPGYFCRCRKSKEIQKEVH